MHYLNVGTDYPLLEPGNGRSRVPRSVRRTSNGAVGILAVIMSVFAIHNHSQAQSSTFEQVDAHFANPPNAFRLIHYGMPDVARFDTLVAYGIGGVQTHVHGKPYLQDEAGWAQIKSGIVQAKQRGFQVWIHDELGYPSGAAGGLVVEGHPEYEARGLIRIAKTAKGNEELTLELPPHIKFIRATMCRLVDDEPDLSTTRQVFISKNSVKAVGSGGEWQLSGFGEKILDKNTQAQSTVKQFGQTGHYPSLLNKDACARFVEVTHQSYADHLDDISEKVDVFYTGEANLMASYWKYDGSTADYPYVPWEQGIVDAFQIMHGYDLMPFLDALFSGRSEQARTVRLHYYQTVAELVAKNYGGQITAWCKKHGVRSLAHPLLEEDIICHVQCYGDMVRFLREFHIKGCDLPIARENVNYWKFWTAKYISSAAYLCDNDSSTIMGLLDPIIYHGMTDLTPEMPILKRTVNMSMLCGLNQFTSYMPFDRKEDGYAADEYRRFNEYVGRICMMLRGCESEAPIAMYYPIKTFQSKYLATDRPWTHVASAFREWQDVVDGLARSILQNGLDFNFVTDDVLLKATVKNGKLMVGTHAYSQLVMPDVEVIPLNVLKRILEIRAAGISVHWVKGIPKLGTTMKEHEKVRALAETLQTNNASLSDFESIRLDEFSIDVETSNGRLCMARFRKENKRIYFVVNDSKQEMTLTAASAEVKRLTLYDPVSGSGKTATLPLSERIGGYESVLLVETIP